MKMSHAWRNDTGSASIKNAHGKLFRLAKHRLHSENINIIVIYKNSNASANVYGTPNLDKKDWSKQQIGIP